jgi:hypothetical protein
VPGTRGGQARPRPDGGWVILNWEHAGPIPPRQELGASLAECDMGDDPVGRRAFLAGYRTSGTEVPTLDMSMFTTAISPRSTGQPPA